MTTNMIIPLPDAVREALESFRREHAPGVYPEAAVTAASAAVLYTATETVSDRTLMELKSALAHLDSDDRVRWVRFAHALKGLGQPGLDLWREWSVKSLKYDDLTARKLWISVHSSRITHRVIFATAQCEGWTNPASTASNTRNIPHGAAPVPKRAADLLARTFNPLRWTIETLLPEGIYLLAGRPKVGKSWMALQMAVAITEGSSALGQQAQQGAVLGLFLEDNERRLQNRFKKHELGQFGNIDLLDYQTEWPRIGEGGAEAIEAWLIEHPRAVLVIVDSLEKIRPQRGHKSVYQDDYNACAELKELSDKYQVTFLIVAHNKKGKSESGDPLELVSGSLGLTGGVDGALIIDGERGKPHKHFYVIGRDIEHEPDDGYLVLFNRASCKWEIVGKAATRWASAAQLSVIDAIRAAKQPQTAKQVGAATKRSEKAARGIIEDLVRADRLVYIEGTSPKQFDVPEFADEPVAARYSEHPDVVPSRAEDDGISF